MERAGQANQDRKRLDRSDTRKKAKIIKKAKIQIKKTNKQTDKHDTATILIRK